MKKKYSRIENEREEWIVSTRCIAEASKEAISEI